MKLSNSALRAELGNELKLLRDSLLRLADYVRQHAGEAWLWQSPGSFRPGIIPPELSRSQTLEGIADALQAIKYEDGQDAHESRIYPGMVALPSAGLALVDEVNRHKVALARVLRAMEGRMEVGTVDRGTGERGERPLREVALEAFYFRRLHHWQATRRLEVLRETENFVGALEYVGFIWANSREVRRTSREALLEQAKAPDARLLSPEDIEIVRRLPPNEALAIVRPGHTIPKANLRWFSRDGAPATTKVRVAVLPLIVPGNQWPPRLRKLPLSASEKGVRAARADVEIEATALCHSLPVFRYLKPVRTAKRKRLSRSPPPPPASGD